MHDGHEQPLDVVGLGVVAAVDQRQGASRPLERERAAHRRAERDEVERARRPHELDDPAAQQLVDVDLLDRLLERRDVGLGDTGFRASSGWPPSWPSTIESSSSRSG